MKVLKAVAILCGVASLTSACGEPPVKPIPDASRKDVAAISADISGLKYSDTSKIGARGSDEGGRLGAAQGAAQVGRSGSLLAVLLMPVGAAVGGAKGAIDAQSEDVVDITRTNLRNALQEVDFTELLRSKFVNAQGAGEIRIVDATAGSNTAPLQGKDGTAVQHVLTLEYQTSLYSEFLVNPHIGIYAIVTAQVQSPDRKTLIHRAAWTYCAERIDFVQVGANSAAILRAQMENAALILGEAISHDLYVRREPRRPSIRGVCMDFSDLPSGNGNLAGPARR